MFTLWAIRFDVDVVIRKSYLGMPELGKLEVCCAIDELRKLVSLNPLHRILYYDAVDLKRVNLSQEDLHILTITSDYKLGESRKDD